MNAVGNLKYFARLKGVNSRSEIKRVLDLVGLTGVSTPLKGYSMGMKQRFGIANALLGRPHLIILDEPINGLDPQGIAEMRDLFKHLNETEGTTFLISSHLLSELSLTASRFGVIHDGRMVATLTRSELDHQTKAQRLEIITDNNERAMALLRQRFGATPGLDEGTILLDVAAPQGTTAGTTTGLNPAAIATALVTNGFEVRELHTRRQSLEDYYFSITGSQAADQSTARTQRQGGRHA